MPRTQLWTAVTYFSAALGLTFPRSSGSRMPGARRRARLCEATDKGSKLAHTVAEEIAETEQQLLAHLSPGDRATLVGLLRQLAFGPFADSAPISGSCI